MSHALPDFIGLCLFFGTSFTAFFLFDPTDAPVVRLIFLAVLIAISLTRTASILLHILLSPGVHDFRMLPTVTAITALIFKNWVRGHILAGGSDQTKSWGGRQLALLEEEGKKKKDQEGQI